MQLASIGCGGSRWVQAVVLLLTFTFFTIPFYVHSFHKADELQPSWSSAEIWMQSADCARTTGAVLVLCRDGKLVPIADVSAGDDPGQALALGISAILTQKAATQNDISRMNSTLNYVGLVLLAGLLFCLRLPIISFLVLTGGAVIANQFHSLGPHPGHLGVACLAVILPLSVVGIPVVSNSRPLYWIWVVVGAVSLGIAMLFREAIGLMGVVANLIAVGASYFSMSAKRRRGLLTHLGLIGVVLFGLAGPQLVLNARNLAFHIAPSGRMEQHGAWHNLYIGLGAVANPFGIEWLDDNGIQAVKKIDPLITYLSKAYYDTLRREYFRIVISHPVQVAVIYLQKFWFALKVYFTWLILLILAATVVWARRRIHVVVKSWNACDSVLVITSCFIVFFLAQATLFNFTTLYLFPIKLFFLLGAGAALQLLVMNPGAGPWWRRQRG